MAVRSIDGAHFVSVPLVYPSGSFVTVRLDPAPGGFKVTDNGFAFREIESIGAQRFFGRNAQLIAAEDNLSADRRTVFVVVPKNHLVAAICDVASASWKLANRIYSKAEEDDQEDVDDDLRIRLASVFGADKLRTTPTVVGASSTAWEFSAVIDLPGKTAVFHAVTNHPASIYRANSAFHDLATLEVPPARIAVVRDKALLGSKLALVAQAANVIQDNQPDDVFRRAAA